MGRSGPCCSANMSTHSTTRTASRSRRSSASSSATASSSRVGLDGCLYAYAQEDWDADRRRASASSTRSAGESRLMQRHFFAQAVTAELDKQGRIVLPAPLLEARGHRARGHRRRRPRPPRDLGPRAGGASIYERSKGARKMLPSVLPTETDHVPVLADEVLAVLAPQPGRDGDRLHLRRRRPRGAARRAPARRGQADRDRPRPDRRAVLRAPPARHAPPKMRLLHGEFSTVLGAARRRTASAPTRSCSTSASRRCSSTGPSAASRTPPTRRSTCGWTRRPS